MAKESATLEILKDRPKTTRKEAKGIDQEMESILGVIKRGAEIIDAEFNIRYVSKRCQETYGDPKGKKCYEYLMGRKKICPNCGIVSPVKLICSQCGEICMLPVHMLDREKAGPRFHCLRCGHPHDFRMQAPSLF